jgi:hypothetical protein
MGLTGPAQVGTGALHGYEDAEIGIRYLDPAIEIVAFSYPGSNLSIDDYVHHRRTSASSEGGDLVFRSETRFFLSTGRYRAASLSYYEGATTDSIGYSLVADTATGSVEVLGWADASVKQALHDAIFTLQLEID